MKKKCTIQDWNKCLNCGKYRSSHSQRYDPVYKKEIKEISCCLGGWAVFDENDNIINSNRS